METETRHILGQARTLISDPARWIQGYMGVNAYGVPYTRGDAPEVVGWCAWGAVQKAAPTFGQADVAVRQLEGVLTQIDGGRGSGMTLDDYNDSHTHAEVLALFDRALRE